MDHISRGNVSDVCIVTNLLRVRLKNPVSSGIHDISQCLAALSKHTCINMFCCPKDFGKNTSSIYTCELNNDKNFRMFPHLIGMVRCPRLP